MLSRGTPTPAALIYCNATGAIFHPILLLKWNGIQPYSITFLFYVSSPNISIKAEKGKKIRIKKEREKQFLEQVQSERSKQEMEKDVKNYNKVKKTKSTLISRLQANEWRREICTILKWRTKGDKSTKNMERWQTILSKVSEKREASNGNKER